VEELRNPYEFDKAAGLNTPLVWEVKKFKEKKQKGRNGVGNE